MTYLNKEINNDINLSAEESRNIIIKYLNDNGSGCTNPGLNRMIYGIVKIKYGQTDRKTKKMIRKLKKKEKWRLIKAKAGQVKYRK